NLVVLIPMILNAHAGTRYGIPFPVYCRASFGILGANVPALLRALVACGCFLFFWAINMFVIYRGIDSIRILLNIKAPLLIILGLALLAWAYHEAGGFGPILEQPSKFDAGGEKAGQFWKFFFP